ncbi:MAG: hypothetical protein A3F83_05935 [Candidatus Glassbacteria bacterium RIFCSPLOWO2_12_FULL_58_11]|uniref:Uncharacterized protein n=1 Tax=Candidatus Glassbacteria bacterium RIFCSPLOWO2_12_FULL_58_11 TaxID=1817867 RepID=A0A1F5YUA7_9BACT|nr:MAG: hypothetical protein A3F83_05935 [Candidatus Glassbacteria bacterium RIFCSPLOWO2_12_FULL_58_11]
MNQSFAIKKTAIQAGFLMCIYRCLQDKAKIIQLRQIRDHNGLLYSIVIRLQVGRLTVAALPAH